MYILEDKELKIVVDKVYECKGQVHFNKVLQVYKYNKNWSTKDQVNENEFLINTGCEHKGFFSDDPDAVKITNIGEGNKLAEILYDVNFKRTKSSGKRKNSKNNRKKSK